MRGYDFINAVIIAVPLLAIVVMAAQDAILGLIILIEWVIGK
jgi:hypothetical protein